VKAVHLTTVKADEVLPGDRGSVLRVEVKDPSDGKVLNSKTLAVHQIDTTQFYDAQAWVDRDLVTVRITRLPDDPISAEEYCQAFVSGGKLEAVVHSDPRLNRKRGPEDGFPVRVPLLHREHADFVFRVEGASPASQLLYTVTAGGVPLKVKVQPPKLPAMPGLPAPAEAGPPGGPQAGPTPPAGG
jgi:hypothetical protein